MLEFLGELVFDGGELGDGEGGEVDCEGVLIYQYEVWRLDIGRIVFVLGWDCGWVGGSLEVILVESLYFVVLKSYSTREHPHRASVCFYIEVIIDTIRLSIPTLGYADTASLRRSSRLGVPIVRLLWAWTLFSLLTGRNTPLHHRTGAPS